MSRLRIISGKYGGRFISADVGRATQPMGDRVRSVLFGIVDVAGARLLDAYAGSGAVGLEALSRGAAEVDFVDNSPRAQRVISENIAALGVEDQTKIYKMSISTFLKGHGNKQKYDIVLIDPPYRAFPKEFSTVFRLKSLVKPNGLMILSYPGRVCMPTVNGVVVVDNREIGEAALALFRVL